MEKRMVLCCACHQTFEYDEQSGVYANKRFWHTSCFAQTAEGQAGVYKQKCDEYIKQIFKYYDDVNWQKINSQLKNLIRQGLSYKDIYQALYYFYDIEKNDVARSQGGIGIVSHVVETANAYFAEQARKASMPQKRIPQIEYKERVIKVSLEPPVDIKNKLINLDEL